MFNKLLTKDELIGQETLFIEETDTLVNGVVKLYVDGYRATCNYKDGKKDGLIEYVYTNGQLGLRGYHQDGKEHGLWEGFYENGEPAMTLNCRKGQPHGKIDYYSTNMDGQLNCRGYFLNGIEDGLWEYFDIDNGEIIEIEYYVCGEEKFNEIPY